MHVIAVSNQKGGVGKTTTALSLASSLALTGKRVLCVDMDPQGNLSCGLGVEVPDGGTTLYEVMTTRSSLASAAYPVPHRGMENLEVVPAGPRLARAEVELMGQVGFDEVLKHKLTAQDGWDVAVLDCPPSLGALTINAIGAADLVLSPVQCEFFSARGVVKLVEVVELVRQRRNPRLMFRVVPTLYDRRNNICRAVLAELRKEFGHEVSSVVVGVDTRMREAQAQATPICLYSPRSRSSLAYEALARELYSIFSAPQGGLHVQAA